MVIAAACLPGEIFGKTGLLVNAATQSATLTEINQSATLTDKLTEVCEALEAPTQVAAKVSYSVTLPSNEQEISYIIELAAEQTPDDRLLGYDYHIHWQLPTPTGLTSGFNAYFSGHCYRYRDNRLTEYHRDWDSIPFIAAPAPQTAPTQRRSGVQRTGQFVNLLPWSLADELRAMMADTSYTITVSGPKPSAEFATDCILIQATQLLNDLVCKEYELQVDAQTGLPLRLSTLYNPSMLGEQEVVAEYSYTPAPAIVPVRTEADLIAIYPDVFANCRTSNFSIENLRGKPLPEFALPTTTGERYFHAKADTFVNPTIIAILDPAVASTEAVIATLRQIVDRLPRQTNLVLMFLSNDIDQIESIAGRLRIGEAHLISAAPFARDCGANAYPTFLLCDSSATVSAVLLGDSSTLAEQLLQQAALLK
jgi:hypothetical protein